MTSIWVIKGSLGRSWNQLLCEGLRFFSQRKLEKFSFFGKRKGSNKNLPSVFRAHCGTSRFFNPKVTPPARARTEAFRPAPVLSTLGGLELRNYGEAVLAASDT